MQVLIKHTMQKGKEKYSQRNTKTSLRREAFIRWYIINSFNNVNPRTELDATATGKNASTGGATGFIFKILNRKRTSMYRLLDWRDDKLKSKCFHNYRQ